jgi:hypothetical protein
MLLKLVVVKSVCAHEAANYDEDGENYPIASRTGLHTDDGLDFLGASDQLHDD